MSGLLKNFFVIMVCIGCAGLAYYLFSSDDSGISSNYVVQQELISKTQSFIDRSARLQEITIDQSFFTDPTFTSLRSFSTAVPNQPLGRNDIFGSTVGITAGAGSAAGASEE